MIKLSITIIIFSFGVFFCQSANSQGKTNVIVQDTLINRLVELHLNTNARERGISGYRVHIFTESGIRSKLRTDNAKVEFDEKYPEVRSYITYDEPNYRIRVGDFRTRLDATRFLQRVQRDYPAAYIVPERINYPELEIDRSKRLEQKMDSENSDE